jgi:hypothetical protein
MLSYETLSVVCAERVFYEYHGFREENDPKKSPQLWKSRESMDWREFAKKNAPRGTFLWNGNPQYLVSVENYFS